MKNSKKQNGITLIALVITIIVLLILAGVSISLLVGNNGILTQASNAVIENRKSSAKEEVALAWASLDSEYYTKWAENSAITKASVYNTENMQKYLNGMGTVGSFRYNEGGKSTINYTSNKAPDVTYSFEISANGVVSENNKNSGSSWTLAVDKNSNGEADIEDEVTSSAGENFYVIAKDDNTVTLIAKYNLATEKNELGNYYQVDAPCETTACNFSSSVYFFNSDFYDLNSATGYSEGDAQEKVITYGAQNGGTGRLPTMYESIPSEIKYGKYATDGYLKFWTSRARIETEEDDLGDTYNYEAYIMCFDGEGPIYGYEVWYKHGVVKGIGVRPVIEIPISNF